MKNDINLELLLKRIMNGNRIIQRFESCLLSVLCLCLAFFTSCSKDDDVISESGKQESKITIIRQSETVIPQDGGDVTIEFEATSPWTIGIASDLASWCSASPTSGMPGKGTVTISIKGNEDYDERNASINIFSGDATGIVSITQKQKDALLVTSDKVEIGFEGETTSIEVKSNVDFSYVIDEESSSWIQLFETRGLSTTVIPLVISANSSKEPRVGHVIISNGELQETVTIYQEGERPMIVLSENQFTIGGMGGEMKLELKSNVNYEIQLPDDNWITENKTRSFSSYTHYFSITPNPTIENREAEIIIIDKSNGIEEKVKVIQTPRTTTTLYGSGWFSELLLEYLYDTLQLDMPVKHIVFRPNMPSLPEGFNTIEHQQIGYGDYPAVLVWDNNTYTMEVQTTAEAFLLEEDAREMFFGLADTESIDFADAIITSETVDMNMFFANCTSLKSADLSCFDLQKVTNIRAMFINCFDLETIVFGKSDTPNLTNMHAMFAMCNSLKNIDLTTFNTSHVTDMEVMFQCCSLLEELDLSSFDTKKVTNMAQMFFGCESLKQIKGRLNTENVTTMKRMFVDCGRLKSIDFSGFNTKNVTDMSEMFAQCEGFTTLDLSAFNTKNVTSMNGMFNFCKNLKSVNLSSFNTSNVTDMSNMFSNCAKLGKLQLNNFNTSKVKDMTEMFYLCESLESVDVSSFTTENIESMEGMFSTCKKLKSLNLNGFKTPKLERVNNLFSGCENLVSLSMEHFDTHLTTNMSGMFFNCESLKSLDLHSFDTAKVTNMDHMLSGCKSIANLDISNFDMSKVQSMVWMCFFLGKDAKKCTIKCNNATKSILVSDANLHQEVTYLWE